MPRKQVDIRSKRFTSLVDVEAAEEAIESVKDPAVRGFLTSLVETLNAQHRRIMQLQVELRDLERAKRHSKP